MTLLLCIYTPAFAAEESYDSKVRKQFELPASWFACNTVDDCTMLKLPCLASIAVTKGKDSSVLKMICEARSCTEECQASMEDTSYAVCEAGQCVTRLR